MNIAQFYKNKLTKNTQTKLHIQKSQCNSTIPVFLFIKNLSVVCCFVLTPPRLCLFFSLGVEWLGVPTEKRSYLAGPLDGDEATIHGSPTS